MARDISPERKAGYYLGMVLIVLGAILFFSLFIQAALNMGNSDFNPKWGFVRAFIGMGMIMAGGVIRGVAARGLRGSGVILDPKGARDDLEPYTRMAGGMVKDALDEADISLASRSPDKVVMIRCPGCGTLNEEDSKFCQECGRKL
ncbi:MAG TPA: zinc ribbon domain-containing protein [Phycisphaerae bacterium]|nr:zinc ribbon domain-containing protein [Phycisphaerae bacterium]HOI56207.1 zinc ribbon domain-containing protein [Phycisphaerae bacterium]